MSVNRWIVSLLALLRQKNLSIVGLLLLSTSFPAVSQQVSQARLEGTVLDAESGSPISDVDVFGPFSSSGPTSGRPQAFTDGNGRFAINLDAGQSIEITARRTG